MNGGVGIDEDEWFWFTNGVEKNKMSHHCYQNLLIMFSITLANDQIIQGNGYDKNYAVVWILIDQEQVPHVQKVYSLQKERIS